MSLNQPLLLSSALVHQVLLSPTTYPYKQVTDRSTIANRWDEKAGLQRDALSSQVIDALRGARDKETGNEEA